VRPPGGAAESRRGPDPPGLVILHECDVPDCIEIEHLLLGTQAQNVRDAARKGHYKSALTTDQAREVRRLLASGERTKDVAARFGVSESVIGRVKQRRSFAWLPED
ncbi:MAG: HNH endonuclease, partial [Rhodospirillales bacterium]|nr:HNH endonuclease [Rhodospirillales bacterium]